MKTCLFYLIHIPNLLIMGILFFKFTGAGFHDQLFQNILSSKGYRYILL